MAAVMAEAAAGVAMAVAATEAEAGKGVGEVVEAVQVRAERATAEVRRAAVMRVVVDLGLVVVEMAAERSAASAAPPLFGARPRSLAAVRARAPARPRAARRQLQYPAGGRARARWHAWPGSPVYILDLVLRQYLLVGIRIHVCT